MEGKRCGELSDHLHLHLHHLDNDFIEDELSGVATTTRIFANVYISKENVPVIPTAHYCMGGIPTNYKGQVLTINHEGCDVIVPGLYACGECACASVHGANRLGANSLLDIMVFAKSCADTIYQLYKPGSYTAPLKNDTGDVTIAYFDTLRNSSGHLTASILRKKIQNIMMKYTGVYRDGKLLKEGIELVKETLDDFNEIRILDKTLIWNSDLMEAIELHNILYNSLAAIISMENRKESRGAHVRDDFPELIDECDYNLELEEQTERPFGKHWRKYLLVWCCPDGETKIRYRPVIDMVLDDTVDALLLTTSSSYWFYFISIANVLG